MEITIDVTWGLVSVVCWLAGIVTYMVGIYWWRKQNWALGWFLGAISFVLLVSAWIMMVV